jgi:hypothetical protein
MGISVSVESFTAKFFTRPKYWIESILRHPHKVKDGRKRILYPIGLNELAQMPENISHGSEAT